MTRYSPAPVAVGSNRFESTSAPVAVVFAAVIALIEPNTRVAAVHVVPLNTSNVTDPVTAGPPAVFGPTVARSRNVPPSGIVGSETSVLIGTATRVTLTRSKASLQSDV